jgi:hypothetical protein
VVNIKITSYEEADDTFQVEIHHDSLETNTIGSLPAMIVPYIAKALCDECEDLPYDLIGQSFTLEDNAYKLSSV